MLPGTAAAYASGYLAEITSRPGDDWAKCPHRKGSPKAAAWHAGGWNGRQAAHRARMERRKQEPV